MSTSERSTIIIEDLFSTMNQLVDAYDENTKRISGSVNGTSFFPGGVGLWRGLKPQGPIRDEFPVRPIMFLGHNFDNENGFNKSKRNHIEPMNTPTWKGQQNLHGDGPYKSARLLLYQFLYGPTAGK